MPINGGLNLWISCDVTHRYNIRALAKALSGHGRISHSTSSCSIPALTRYGTYFDKIRIFIVMVYNIHIRNTNMAIVYMSPTRS